MTEKVYSMFLVRLIMLTFAITVLSCKDRDPEIGTINYFLEQPMRLQNPSRQDSHRLVQIRQHFPRYEKHLTSELRLTPYFLSTNDVAATTRYNAVINLLGTLSTPESGKLVERSLDEIFTYMETEWPLLEERKVKARRRVPPTTQKLLLIIKSAIRKLEAMEDSSFAETALKNIEKVDDGTRITLINYLSRLSLQDSTLRRALVNKFNAPKSQLYKDPYLGNILTQANRKPKGTQDE